MVFHANVKTSSLLIPYDLFGVSRAFLHEDRSSCVGKASKSNQAFVVPRGEFGGLRFG